MRASTDHLALSLSDRLRQLAVSDTAPGRAPGFGESAAPFDAQSRDTQRFNESVRLARTFAAIEDTEDRHLLLEIAERLAAKVPG